MKGWYPCSQFLAVALLLAVLQVEFARGLNEDTQFTEEEKEALKKVRTTYNLFSK
jgi:hypothetical protein